MDFLVTNIEAEQKEKACASKESSGVNNWAASWDDLSRFQVRKAMGLHHHSLASVQS